MKSKEVLTGAGIPERSSRFMRNAGKALGNDKTQAD